MEIKQSPVSNVSSAYPSPAASHASTATFGERKRPDLDPPSAGIPTYKSRRPRADRTLASPLTPEEEKKASPMVLDEGVEMFKD